MKPGMVRCLYCGKEIVGINPCSCGGLDKNKKLMWDTRVRKREREKERDRARMLRIPKTEEQKRIARKRGFKKWYSKKENKIKLKETKKRWWEKNKEKLNRKSRIHYRKIVKPWRKAHPKECKKDYKNHYKKYKEKIWAHHKEVHFIKSKIWKSMVPEEQLRLINKLTLKLLSSKKPQLFKNQIKRIEKLKKKLSKNGPKNKI